jgi:hypothetical protein
MSYKNRSPVLFNGDVLDADHAVRFEQRVELAAIRREIAVAQGLHHFDGNDLIELSFDFPVILQQDFNAFTHPLTDKTLFRIAKLLLGNRHRRHPASVIFHGMTREPSPAAADFQDVVAFANVQLPAKCVVFLRLS